MPTNRTPIRHPHRGRLSHEQEMVLQYGAEERWAEAFATEEEYRDAWIRNRDRLLAGYRNGRRPMAWWTLESPIAFPGYEQQQSVLYEANLLEPEERAALVEWWRAQFERAWAPHFFIAKAQVGSLRASQRGRRTFVGRISRASWCGNGRRNVDAGNESLASLRRCPQRSHRRQTPSWAIRRGSPRMQKQQQGLAGVVLAVCEPKIELPETCSTQQFDGPLARATSKT
jgi:hypothetical protein